MKKVAIILFIIVYTMILFLNMERIVEINAKKQDEMINKHSKALIIIGETIIKLHGGG